MTYDRKDVDKRYKWRLEDIFPSDEAWEKEFATVEALANSLAGYSGKLADRAILKECLDACFSCFRRAGLLYQYAHMKQDEDTRDATYQGKNARAEMLMVRLNSLTSYLQPEISEFSREELIELSKAEDFKDYDVFFKEIIRNKDIILSKAEEKLLGEAGLFADTNEEVYVMFDNADLKLGVVRDENGGRVELSHGTYGTLLQSPSQKVRANAFRHMFSAYRDHKNMLAANYAGNVKKDWFFAKIRGFESALEYSMYKENVPPVCYNKLLEAVGEGTKALHRYVALRKRALGLKTLNMYDLYLPIVPEQDISLEYDDAVELVKKALSVMGEEYSSALASAFESGWVDVYENKGKKSGAYSWGVYGSHPFVLLNYHKNVHEVFTIAHELGHAMHSYFSNLAQPYTKADYEIFCAEIASTVNEVLLLKYLLKSAEGEFRKYLLSYYLDMFRTTLFRQTMFSEFEVIAHTAVEKGEPLTADGLSEEYYKLNKKYYGKAVKHNDLIRYEWARIPHFYTSYYVYKYATGITTAVSIANNLIERGSEYFEKYRRFLSAGGSMPPIDIIRLAEVDLTSDEPYKLAMREFERTLDELEKMMK